MIEIKKPIGCEAFLLRYLPGRTYRDPIGRPMYTDPYYAEISCSASAKDCFLQQTSLRSYYEGYSGERDLEYQIAELLARCPKRFRHMK